MANLNIHIKVMRASTPASAEIFIKQNVYWVKSVNVGTRSCGYTEKFYIRFEEIIGDGHNHIKNLKTYIIANISDRSIS